MARARLARRFIRVLGGLLLGSLGITACAGQSLPGSLPMAAALDAAAAGGRARVAAELRGRLTEQETFGYVAPYAPVVLPPEIRRVWVPTHQNAEGELVAGHWVYLRLTDFRWFTEAPPVPLRLGASPAAPPVEPPPTPPPLLPGGSPSPLTAPWVEGAPAGGKTSSPVPSPGPGEAASR